LSNILVTAIGSFSADIIIKNLKKEGNYVIGCDIYPKEWIIDAQNVDLFYQSPYANNIEEYVNFICKICDMNKIDFIMPLTDPEVEILSKHKKRVEAYGAILCTSDYETIQLCRDKYKLPKFLAEHDIPNSISTFLLDEIDVKEFSYPFFAKPRSGRSSQGCMLINDKTDFQYIVEKCKKEQYIIQPYIEGKIITVDVVRNETSGMVSSMCRRELIRNNSGAGLTVEIFHDIFLSDLCKKIANVLNIRGTVNIEFIESSNGYYFLEVNPRFSGGVEFSCIAGYDVITQHLNCFRDLPIIAAPCTHKMIISKKYEECVTWEERNDK